MSDCETGESTKMVPRNEFEVKKLTGSDNYHTWQYAMLNYFELNNLDDCIIAKENDPSTPKETKAEKLKQAKARLALSVDESLFVHIRKAKSAMEIWRTLQNLFEDKGLLRKIGLLRQLISVRLEKSSSMQGYVSEIISTSNKLSGIGFDIDDEWLGAILLAGLTDQFKPMIMSIEGSGVKITADSIKQKLLDSHEKDVTSGEAFVAKKKFNSKVKRITCYSCGGKNHKSVDCLQKSDDSSGSESDSVKSIKRNGKANCVFGIQSKRKMFAHNPLGSNGSTATAFMARHNFFHEDRNRFKEKSVAVRADDITKTIVDSIDGDDWQRGVWKKKSVDVNVLARQNIKASQNGEDTVYNVPTSEVFGCLVNLVKGILPDDDVFGASSENRLKQNYSIGHLQAVKEILFRLQSKVDRQMKRGQES